MIAAFYFMVWALNLVDLQLTHEIIRLGGTELNPVMAPLFAAGWVWPLVYKVLACTAIGLIIKHALTHSRSDALLCAAFAMAVSMLPVAWNLWVLLQAIQMGQ